MHCVTKDWLHDTGVYACKERDVGNLDVFWHLELDNVAWCCNQSCLGMSRH